MAINIARNSAAMAVHCVNPQIKVHAIGGMSSARLPYLNILRAIVLL
jgi:hypothetical protein